MNNCPTCGSPVKVVGDVTQHYELDLSRFKVEVDDENIKELCILYSNHPYECAEAIIKSNAFKIGVKDDKTT
jgi:hypothetical protein